MRKEKPETGADRSETGFHPSSVRPRSAIPKRRLGQNFLVDKNAIERIISAVDPQPDETIIEIGPGRGALKVLTMRHYWWTALGLFGGNSTMRGGRCDRRNIDKGPL